MELNEAVDIMLTANGSSLDSHRESVTVMEFVEAINVVLDAMRNEITTSDAMKWCLDHRPPSVENKGY